MRYFKFISIIIFLAVLSFVYHKSAQAAKLPNVTSLEERLREEVRKMIDAGHLRPSYTLATEHYAQRATPDNGQVYHFDDVWHNPADTIYTLAIVYPYMPDTAYPSDTSKTWKQKLKDYMQSEFNNYKPYQWSHMGSAGNFREVNDIPNSLKSDPGYSKAYNINGSPSENNWAGWPSTINPFNYYALYKYAQIFNNAPQVLSLLRSTGNEPPALPSDSFLKDHPHVLNSYIAGYYGYLGLQQLAGESQSSSVNNLLTSARNKRISNLSVDPKTLSPFESGGFLWLVPEFGDYLNKNAKSQVENAVNLYGQSVPYWAMARADEATRIQQSESKSRSLNEGSYAHPYDHWSFFSAHALALKKGRSELENYLDAPIVYRGDLFYIQNLVYTLEASGTGPTPSPVASPSATPYKKGDVNHDGLVNQADMLIILNNFSSSASSLPNYFDPVADGKINVLDWGWWRRDVLL